MPSSLQNIVNIAAFIDIKKFVCRPKPLVHKQKCTESSGMDTLKSKGQQIVKYNDCKFFIMQNPVVDTAVCGTIEQPECQWCPVNKSFAN